MKKSIVILLSILLACTTLTSCKSIIKGAAKELEHILNNYVSYMVIGKGTTKGAKAITDATRKKSDSIYSFSHGEKLDGSRINFGEFSFCPPLEWELTKVSGFKYDIVTGPMEKEFTVKMTFEDDTYNGNLKEYVDLNITLIEKSLQKYTLLDRKIFKTNSGIEGESVIINNQQYRNYLKQVIYFLPMKDNKYLSITCSILDKVSEKYLPLFEESVKTLAFLDEMDEANGGTKNEP
jgi:predicted small secreted protein